jgi:tol-pal system protein YbgF
MEPLFTAEYTDYAEKKRNLGWSQRDKRSLRLIFKGYRAMKRILFLVLLIALSAAKAQGGTKEDIAQIQRNLLEIQQQIWDLEARLKNNSSSVEGTVKGVQDSTEELRQVQASLNAKLERILNEIQVINEKIDDTNRRVRDISVPAATVLPPGGNSDEEEPPQANTAQVPAPSGSRPAATPTTVAPAVGEQQLYQDALGLYTKGRFEQALRGFQDLLDQFPGSPLSDDAQFMIGESYYGMKEYVDAVSEFDKVVKSYPDSDRVPGARLKKAFSLFSLGKKGQGVVELQQIAQRYPTTKEADIARQRLEELGLE